MWNKLSEEEQRFVLLHEEGHLVLQTRNELAADRYAFDKYVGEGHSLKKSISALTKVLRNSPEHLTRTSQIFNRALQHQNNNNNMTTATGSPWIAEAWENASGKQKRQQRREERKEKRQEKKEARQARKEDKKELRVQRKYDRNDRKNLRNEARAEQKVLLAEKGVTAGGLLTGGLGNAIGNIGSTAAALTGGGLLPPAMPTTNFPTLNPAEMQLGGGGGGGSFQENFPTASAAPFETESLSIESGITPQKKNNTGLLIAAAVAFVVIIALIFKR